MSYRLAFALGVASLAACATAAPGEGTDAQPGRDGGTSDARPDGQAQIDANCGTIQMELLTNPAFDASPALMGWTETRIEPTWTLVGSTPIPGLSAPNRARLGAFTRPRAMNGDQLHQDVAIPANAMDLTLTGSYQIASLEPIGTFDLGQVDLASTSNNPFEVVIALSNADEGTSWTPFTKLFANAHAGETVRVRMTTSSDDSFATSFYFDSLSLKATVPATVCP